MVVSVFNAHSQVIRDTIPQCDTLRYPLPGTPSLYVVESPGSGFVCGNNTYGDLAKADYFVPPVTGNKIHKALLAFGHAAGASGLDPDVEFRIWNNNGSNGYPGDVLGTTVVKLSQIIEDMGDQHLTEVVFDPPVQIMGAFYLGVMLPTTPGDIVGLVSTLHEEVDIGTAYEIWSDGTWHAFTETSSWNLRISQAIHPIYCEIGFSLEEEDIQPEVRIYPNPAMDILHIELDAPGPVKISLVNLLGQSRGSWSFDQTGTTITLPVQHLSQGIYLLRITGNDYQVTRKVMKR